VTDASVSHPTLNLEYWFAQSAGYEIIGSEDGPFALWSERERSIYVFGSAESVKFSSFKTNCMDKVLEAALFFGASLRVEGTSVTCELGLITCRGDDYIEAMLKALIVHQAAGILGPPKPSDGRALSHERLLTNHRSAGANL